MPTSRENRPRSEMTQLEFEQLVTANPKWTAKPNGIYTVEVKLRGGVWNKPVAYKKDGKFFKFDD